MKKIIPVIFFWICCLSLGVFADTIDRKDISYEQEYGDIRSVRINGGGEYITDGYYNIISGPYTMISSYNEYPLAHRDDGGKVMFDHDGAVLAEVGSDGEIYPVANGLYAVSPTVKSMDETGEFILYDYESKEEIARLHKPFFYYLEEQNDKMFIDKDGKFAVIDKYGNYLTDFIYDDVKKRFNPAYTPYPASYAIVVLNGEEKYIDWELNEIKLENYNGSRFITQYYHMSYNNTAFKEYYHAESGNMHAVYNADTDEFIIPFTDEYTFTEMNDEIILIKNEGKFGIINHSGMVITEPVYDLLVFSELEGLLIYRKGDKNGYFDISRGIEVSDFVGQTGGNGVMIDSYYDYSGEYRQYCSEIKNFRGKNLTGDIYRFCEYKDGAYYNIESYDPYNARLIEFDEKFTIINLNGRYLDFDGTIRESRTLVPMREIVEGLGGKVDWIADTMTAVAYIDGKIISMSIGNNVITVDGKEQVIDVSAQLINEKTMLPVRALCENLGADVGWDERIRCVYINR